MSALPTSNYQSKAKRPFSVTLLALFVLTIACINLIRFAEALLQWNFLASQPGVSSSYIAITGLLWAALGLPLFLGLWLGLRWSPLATRLAVLSYTLYAWIDRLFIAKNPPIQDNHFAWPLLTSVYIVVIILILWILSTRQVRNYFQRLGVLSHDGSHES